MSKLMIREPAELLLGVPVGMQTNWRHQSAALVTGHIRYEVNYLGSTVVKELRGTESTRKSIQKLKRDDQPELKSTTARGEEPIQLSTGTSDDTSTSAGNCGFRPLFLSISHRGVQFIDISTQVC